MEATMFTGWIYNHLKPHAAALKVGAAADAAGHRRREQREKPYRRVGGAARKYKEDFFGA